MAEEEEEEEDPRTVAVVEPEEGFAVEVDWEVRKEEETLRLLPLQPSLDPHLDQTMEAVLKPELRQLEHHSPEGGRRGLGKDAAALEDLAHTPRHWEVDVPFHEELVCGWVVTVVA